MNFYDSSLSAETDIGLVILTHQEAAQIVQHVGAVALPPVGHHLGSFLSHGSRDTARIKGEREPSHHRVKYKQ